VLRKRLLKLDTIGLIPTGEYSCNVNQSKKALLWLSHRERTDGCSISHGRNGREFRLPELRNLSVDGYCHETRKVYEFNGCFWHGHTGLTFRDVATFNEDTLRDMNKNGKTRKDNVSRVSGRGRVGMSFRH